MSREIELLAPAGNMESLKAAVAAGANAIYLGLTNFSARAFAGNFTHEEFQEAISYCHIRDVKIYVTINTMLYETEIENVKNEVAFLYENQCDGLLIQDYGLFDYVRTYYPDMEVHCSTQMHIHNVAGVKQMKDEGAARVVLARETPIEVIREACKVGVDIEVFAYGAICISYSGQCLMSAATKNRSANRGMCAQCCRLLYYPKQGKHFEEGDYILSPKDLNTIDNIPVLLDAGVKSLKIEGRMKRPEYVWLVIRTFREAIDAYKRGELYHVDPKREKELLLMFNRGFSKGHIFHADVKDRMSQYRPNHQGVEIGRVLSFKNGKVQVKLSDALHQHDGLRILNEPNDTGLTAVKIYDEKMKLVSSANKGDVVWLDCHSKPTPKKGQPLRKTSDSVLISEIDECIADEPFRTPVSMKYEAFAGKPFVLHVYDNRNHDVKVVSQQPLENAKNMPLSKEKIEKSLSKLGDQPYRLTSIEGETDSVFMPVSLMNELRRSAIEQLNELRKSPYERTGRKDVEVTLKKPEAELPRLLVSSEMSLSIENEHAAYYTEGTNEHQILPVVQEDLTEPFEHNNMILSSMADFYGTHHNSIAGMTMNIANSYAIAYALKKGASGVIFSSECSELNIEQALSAFEARYHFKPMTYKLVYGKRTAMYIKNGFVSNQNLKEMQDLHGNIYEISYDRNIAEIKEPDTYRAQNDHCYGSYIILDSMNHSEEIMEEAYEELYERI